MGANETSKLIGPGGAKIGEGRYFGKGIARQEDAKLLAGRGTFVDDIDLPGMLHAAVLRSPYAHARILSIDTAAALERPGVHAVYTAADVEGINQRGPLCVPPPPIEGIVFHERTQTPLATAKVRYVGEALALVVADSRAVAEDALADIAVDYEPLDVAATFEQALACEGSAQVHEDLPNNIASTQSQFKGHYAQAAAQAHTIVKRRLYYDHGCSSPMETRGVVAQWDARAEKLTMWDTTQAPVFMRNGIAARFGLSERQVRVIAPNIGGGFGPKIFLFYPEEILVPHAAMQLGRPVKWIEDRAEHFVSTTQERDQWHEAEMALDASGRILGVKDSFTYDTGAYNPYGLTVPLNSQCTLLGQYDIANYESHMTMLFTNKPIVSPYRGAGRQHGVFVIERLMDAAAAELGIDRAEIRRRNLIKPEQFPYNNVILYQDFAPLGYDSGQFELVLDKAMAAIGWREFIDVEQPKLRAAGRCVGIGLVTYVEGTGIGPYEGARVQVQANGRVSLLTGVGTQGQGHFTSFAQIVADAVGAKLEDVEVITGDTDQFYWGAGTFASRGAVVAGNAIAQAGEVVRQKILAHAAEHFECSPADIVLGDGAASINGVPGKRITLAELAAAANPLRGAVKPGTEPGLEGSGYFAPASSSTASGAHAMIVEVDPETFMPTILKYVVVHDCGTVINPLIVEGQVLGGVAQGIGNAFFEKLHYDDQGQLLNASLADYLLPTSLDVPHVTLDHVVTPSPLNPLGIKGVGEAGAIPAGPLFAQALEDALQLRANGREITEIPLSPSRLWEITQGTA